MYREIEIGDKKVPMLALASVDVYYKKIFREDPLAVMTSDADNATKSRIAFNMGFVMAKFAELHDRKKMLQLTEDNYLEWLEQFEYGDYIKATGDILLLYYSQKSGTATEKNTVGA